MKKILIFYALLGILSLFADEHKVDKAILPFIIPAIAGLK